MQMRDSCLMQGFGFRPNGCIIPKSKDCGIVQVKGIHQGAVILRIGAWREHSRTAAGGVVGASSDSIHRHVGSINWHKGTVHCSELGAYG